MPEREAEGVPVSKKERIPVVFTFKVAPGVSEVKAGGRATVISQGATTIPRTAVIIAL